MAAQPKSKFRAFMKNHISLVLLALAALGCGPALAEKADRNKPMNIEADALRYDDLQQISVFTGHVVLTKGTIVIRGEQVEVRQDPEGFQYGVVTAAPGKLAFFRQKREALDEFIEGEGELIEYNGKADTVKFTRKALMRRLRGAVLADEVSGNVIVYENLTDFFTVDGAAGKSRVRAMLTPKPEAASPAPTAPAVTLRPAPAPRLEGGK
jgi:lipopolysaccharide export system protein LptA